MGAKKPEPDLMVNHTNEIARELLRRTRAGSLEWHTAVYPAKPHTGMTESAGDFTVHAFMTELADGSVIWIGMPFWYDGAYHYSLMVHDPMGRETVRYAVNHHNAEDIGALVKHLNTVTLPEQMRRRAKGFVQQLQQQRSGGRTVE